MFGTRKIFAASCVIAASVCVFGIPAASAAVIDFENQPSGSCAYVGSSFTTQGFVFTKGSLTNGGFFQCNPGVLQNNTSKAMIEANGVSDWMLTAVGGAAFSLQSFQAGTRTQDYNASIPSSYAPSTGVTLLGTKSDTTTVSQSFVWSGINFDTFNLSSLFTDLVSVRWTANGTTSSREFVFDNIAVNSASVPEPGTLALIGFGLAGLGLRRRRKAA